MDGEVDLATSPELRRTLFEALAAVGKLALNLSAIRYIDSSGIATLIEVLNRSRKLKKEFVLFGLSPAVEKVFRLTHVDRVFQVFQTEQEALGVVMQWVAAVGAATGQNCRVRGRAGRNLRQIAAAAISVSTQTRPHAAAGGS